MDPEAVFKSSTRIVIRPAYYNDAEILGRRLRQADLDEIQATLGMNGVDALHWSFIQSDMAWTMTRNGIPVLIFGTSEIAGAPEGTGSIWMMASPDIEEPDVRWAFLRNCKPILQSIQEKYYSVVTNVVDVRNVLHIRWLMWMGFQAIREIPEYGPEQRPFIHFYRSVI